MLDFTNFTTQDWIAIGSLAVSTLMLISNVVIAVWAATRTSRKVAEAERVINRRLRQMQDKLVVLDRSDAYVIGVLDGAGLTRERGTRPPRRRRRR